MKLGKQHWNGVRQSADLEIRMLDYMGMLNITDLTRLRPLPNDIFLFEIQQLSDENRSRHDQFKADIQHFLQLNASLPDMIHFRPGMEWHDALQKTKDEKKIDICDDQFIPTRIILMQMSRLSSEWIRHAFLDIPGVYSSSRAYIEHTLATEWMVDPCGDKADYVSEAELGQIIMETTGRPFHDLNTLALARLQLNRRAMKD